MQLYAIERQRPLRRGNCMGLAPVMHWVRDNRHGPFPTRLLAMRSYIETIDPEFTGAPRENCGLSASWRGERVYCNPPYSDIRPWIEKAWGELEAQLVVMLLPANRTEQRWWQDLIEPRRDRSGSPLRTEFLPGRLRFLKPEADEIKPNERPPFGCVLCIWTWVP